MESVEFQFVEKYGKTYLICHLPKKYRPRPHTGIFTSSADEATSDEPLLSCPGARQKLATENAYKMPEDTVMFQLKSSHEYFSPSLEEIRSLLDIGRYDTSNHPVTYNIGKKGINVTEKECEACKVKNLGANHYGCSFCGEFYHKDCVESPLEIKHPYHPQHLLQLFSRLTTSFRVECLCCGTEAKKMVYHCTICQIFMHPTCALKPISFVIDQPKRHPHPLTFFPRQASLTCNVCGLLKPLYPTFVCLRCNFVAHKDCMHFPTIIKISRHLHRVSYTSSLPYGEWSCGVCRRKIDNDYGAYTCNKCGDYAVHPICAMRPDICDGKELEGVPEEDDITKDAPPFETFSDGVILHFLHQHHLRLEVIILYDENKCCHACSLPIYEGDFYSCTECECDFILHKVCANARRRIQHDLNALPLALDIQHYGSSFLNCAACQRCFDGFTYEGRTREGRYFYFDIRCASISEPFDYKGHEHPLYLALDPGETPICNVCKLECHKQLNCIVCDFIVCFKCATLPYKARYRHDQHFLTLLSGKEVCEKDWCEACERNLGDTNTKAFYGCNECFTTLHIGCWLGQEFYVRPGKSIFIVDEEIIMFPRNYVTRPFCIECKRRCEDKIFRSGNFVACSRKCCKKFSRHGRSVLTV